MDNKLVLIIVSLLLPPLAVGLKKGVGNRDQRPALGSYVGARRDPRALGRHPLS